MTIDQSIRPTLRPKRSEQEIITSKNENHFRFSTCTLLGREFAEIHHLNSLSAHQLYTVLIQRRNVEQLHRLNYLRFEREMSELQLQGEPLSRPQTTNFGREMPVVTLYSEINRCHYSVDRSWKSNWNSIR
jgi:hypothetical protein